MEEELYCATEQTEEECGLPHRVVRLVEVCVADPKSCFEISVSNHVYHRVSEYSFDHVEEGGVTVCEGYGGGTSCRPYGTRRVRAYVSLSGRGTGRLDMEWSTSQGSADVTFTILCDEVTFGQGQCGDRSNSSDGYTTSYSYPFAANQEGYKFEDASDYSLKFRWNWTYPDGPLVGGPAVDTPRIRCPSGSGDPESPEMACYFPDAR